MSPVLVQGTIFANAYYLQNLAINQPVDGSQQWESYLPSKRLDVFLQVFPEASPQVAKTFKEDLAKYQAIENDHLIALIDYNVNLDNLPYLVTKTHHGVTVRSSPPIENDKALADLVCQLTNALLSLHRNTLSPKALTVDTVYLDGGGYKLSPVIKAMNGDGYSDLQALGELCGEMAPSLSTVKQLVEWIKPGTTVDQLNDYAAKGDWPWDKVEQLIQPNELKPEESPVSPEVPQIPIVLDPPPSPPFPYIILAVVGTIIAAVFIYQFWLKLPVIPATANPSLTYKTLLEKGQQFVQISAKDSAVTVFSKAVKVQQDNGLPESNEAKYLYNLYKDNADKQFASVNDPAMYSMMNTPKDYYELCAALKDSPELQSKIETCKRLLKHK